MSETKKHGNIIRVLQNKASTYCANKDYQVVICHPKGKVHFLQTKNQITKK
jgi:hypothetical protein